MNGYINSFGENNKNKNTIIMPFKVKDRQLLKNYNKICKKIKRLMSIDFDSKPVYGNDDKYIKTKIKHIKTVWLQIFVKKGSKKIPEEKVSC